MKKIGLLILLILIFSNCVDSMKKENKTLSNKNILESNYFSHDQFLILENDAVNKGNLYAYNNLLVYYSANQSRYFELLPISIIMSEKYNSLKANIVIYETIIRIYNNGVYKDEYLVNLTKTQSDLALFYLTKGAKKKIPSCIKTLEKLYRKGIFVKKNIIKADSLASIDISIYPNG